MFQSVVVEQLRSFSETTSVRGVSRTVRSTVGVLRSVWLTAVLASLSVTVWQVNKVAVEYLKYETITVMHEFEIRPFRG